MSVNHRKITHERLGRWEKRLETEKATPIIMVGVGHNEKNGQLVVVTTEDRTDHEVILLLEEALRRLKTPF